MSLSLGNLHVLGCSECSGEKQQVEPTGELTQVAAGFDDSLKIDSLLAMKVLNHNARVTRRTGMLQ